MLQDSMVTFNPDHPASEAARRYAEGLDEEQAREFILYLMDVRGILGPIQVGCVPLPGLDEGD